MKKGVFTILLSMLLPMTMLAQSYSSLWKSVDVADTKDLQQDKLKALTKIAKKAEAEKEYGHLFKALLLQTTAKACLSPDSLQPEVERLEAREAALKDDVAKAVFSSALGHLYNLRADGARDAKQKTAFASKSKVYYAQSLQNVAKLAAVKTSVYEPFMVEANYSKIFNDDMLHVLGYEAKAFKVMHDYYAASGNRNAACITALEIIRRQEKTDETEVRKSRYLQSVDSLINIYGDLKVAGELALEHYKCLEQIENATAAEKVQYINYAVSKWGAWPPLNYLRNAKMELERPRFDINVGDMMLLPNMARKVRVNSICNISQLDLAVYRLSLAGDTELDPNNDKDYQKIKKHIVGTVVHTDQLRYVGKAAYDEYADSMSIAPLPVGVYLLEVTTDNNSIKPERCLLHVTNLYTMSEKLPNNALRIAVVNATTGAPISGAKVRLCFNERWTEQKIDDITVTTGANGEVVYQCPKQNPYTAYTYTADDNACAKVGLSGFYHGKSYGDSERSVVNTDRSIYRPGQKVNVSVVCWKPNSKALTAAPVVGKEVTLKLRDANYQDLASQVVTTDEYGQASAVFDLPANGITGSYRIYANSNTTAFRVEKYKRPTFTVDLDKVTTAYSVGDTLKLTGTARSYAGMPIQNAKVKYTIKRNVSSWWRMWFDGNDRQLILNDTVLTDDNGRFTLLMPMLLPEQKSKSRLYFNIEATALVTDAAGETQQGFLSLPLSNVSTVFTCNLPEKNLVDSLPSLTFNYLNISGEKIAGNVAYTIDGKPYHAQANTAIDLKPLKLHSGLHQLKAICGTDTIARSFVVFSLKDKKAPVETHDWYYQSSTTFPATIQIGNTDDEHHIYYNVFSNGEFMQSGILEGHNSLHNHTFNYKSEYGDGITVTYAWVHHGHLYTHTARISRPQPDKHLNMSWTSFRDKLTPGQNERWTLKITTPDSKPADAQLMATLYDKSLDALSAHSLDVINNGSFFNLYTPSASWRGGSNQATGLHGYQSFNYLPYKYMQLSHFYYDCFSMPYSKLVYVRGYGNNRLMAKSDKVMACATEMAAMAPTEKQVLAEKQVLVGAIAGLSQKESAQTSEAELTANASVQLRENFSETAFFAPSLTTNAQGEVAISFTLPESATTWRFLGLAHDKQMNSATIQAEAVASKKVMVQPNMPRFVRHGDKAVIAARISNTTTDALKGTARIEILEAESGRVVFTQQKSFSLQGEETQAVSFNFSATEGFYICRIVASGKGFSDGEQHYLPVLSDKQMVTTTIPFTQTSAATLTLSLDSVLPAKADKRKLTVEYTNNPSWLMIQTLPTVSEYCNQSSLSLASAYYATTISANILQSNPEIKKAIDSWTADNTSLLSNLQRNDELKSIVLSESPWMLDAQDESGQKALLATYYNKNNLSYKLSSINKLLAETQNADGSFSWWKGMRSSTYVTTSVATLLSRLSAYGYSNSDVETMLSKAMAYLDAAATSRMHEMKKQKQPSLSSVDLDYLYLCALTKAGETPTIKYFKSLLLKANRKVDIRTKAIAAIALGKDNATAREYVESIKQYTVSKPGMGRYFDTPRALYSWRNYRIPTQVAAIEAIAAVTPADRATIDDMRLWLLQQKRTQSWDTPLNSVDAIHAFLVDNDEVLNQPSLTTIALDGKALPLPEATAAVGYVKTTIDNPKASEISFAKTSDGASWGAVYGQSLQPIAAVKSANAGICVERTIGTAGKSLRVGDKVKVTITIVADRDYDFVQLCDKRAACLEPVSQLSGYRNGYYLAPQDNCTNYFFDRLSKGKHVVETEYFVDRPGSYLSGVCTAECAYSPEFSGRAEAVQIVVNE